MRFRRVREETRRRFVLKSGFVSAPKSLEQAGITEMKFAVVGLKTQRLFHVWYSCIVPGLRRQGSGKVHMRLGISRLVAERDFILLFCLLPLAFFLQRPAVIKMLFRTHRHICYKPCSPLELWNHDVRLPKPERA